jgi:hypothetical protein
MMLLRFRLLLFCDTKGLSVFDVFASPGSWLDNRLVHEKAIGLPFPLI